MGNGSLYYGSRAKIITPVRILMIAPEPFFEPRGTPFSEFHRIRALTTLGHEVDLVTYPFGQPVEMPGLRIFRSLRPPFVRRVAIESRSSASATEPNCLPRFLVGG